MGQMEFETSCIAKLDNSCYSTLQQSQIEQKLHNCCTVTQDGNLGRDESGWTQRGRQQEHSSSTGQIITHHDGTATWYSLHIH